MFYVPVCNFALPCFIIPPRPPIVKVLKQEVKPLCWSDHETTVLQTVNLKKGKEIGRKYEENHHLIIILIITFRRKIKMASTHQLLNSLINVYLFICLKVFSRPIFITLIARYLLLGHKRSLSGYNCTSVWTGLLIHTNTTMLLKSQHVALVLIHTMSRECPQTMRQHIEAFTGLHMEDPLLLPTNTPTNGHKRCISMLAAYITGSITNSSTMLGMKLFKKQYQPLLQRNSLLYERLEPIFLEPALCPIQQRETNAPSCT